MHHLCLSKGEVYLKTLLEHAKLLTILASCMDPVSTIMLLSPHTKQVGYLDFVNSHWADIQRSQKLILDLSSINMNLVRGLVWTALT